ncbi:MULTISPECIES: ABC transporter ATP-binding protein [unclassified Schaalia]|uniref:ABC transporter ATP-binding protein n=1 Tax=unclassified Schaalia TaxID=2691889 RepID=UPI001E55FDE1|nr:MULTISPECIES: ABC transporter ATP-binding protein [unclassified Schaalia]MCD4550011.1 ABC transporter ATP-binding protein [Schaalia sp. lx-260]MCD4557921.1 ABC transporter ATP-binding protein [Schaalia sp. lx-100]
MSITPVVRLQSVSKIYGSGEAQVIALDNVSVDFAPREFTAIIGPSGCGKSTMLHTLAGLDHVTSGSVTVDGVALDSLNDNALTELRRDRIGFIFQSFNLVPTLDAQANILLPLRLAGQKADNQWFQSIVKILGLEKRLTHRPHELSGGQQQRVAVARALISRPAVLVADEPTGNLDSQASREVLGLLHSAVKELNQSVIMVTHDLTCAEAADRVLVMRDGHIVEDMRHPQAEALQEALR